jgi:L,D-transpeptidase catalytic domain
MRFPFRGALAPALLCLAAAGCGGLDPGTQSVEPEGEDVAAAPSELDISLFNLPPAGAPERAAIVAKYPALDPTGVIPRGLLEDAIAFFDINKAYIPKQAYFVVVDFAPYSGEDRFFMVDVGTGAVEPHKVAHGDGTDPDNDGYADYFGNQSGSHMSSLGFYLTGEIYDGTHPHSMRIDGLSPDGSANGMANTNVRDRLIVVHEASYVDDGNTSQQGRSNGCFALDSSIEVSVVDRIHDGTMMYAATSPLNEPVGSSGGTGAGGSGGSPSLCSPPECGSCANCYDQCLCDTGDPTACTSACGSGGAGGGSSGAGGAAPSSCASPECSGCATCYERCVCEGSDGSTCAQVCANESKPPTAPNQGASDQSGSCGAASIVGSSPDPRSSGLFLAALALGLCGWRLRRR